MGGTDIEAAGQGLPSDECNNVVSLGSCHPKGITLVSATAEALISSPLEDMACDYDTRPTEAPSGNLTGPIENKWCRGVSKMLRKQI